MNKCSESQQPEQRDVLEAIFSLFSRPRPLSPLITDQLTANDVQLAFSSFDLNNDGFIDKEELAHAMSHIGFRMEPEEIDGENYGMKWLCT